MIGLDASIVFEVVLSKPVAASMAGRPRRARATLHALHLLNLEVMQPVRRHLAKQEIDVARETIAQAKVLNLPNLRFPNFRNLRVYARFGTLLRLGRRLYGARQEARRAPAFARVRRLGAAAERHENGASFDRLDDVRLDLVPSPDSKVT